MKIIDAHVHLGFDYIFDGEVQSEEQIINTFEEFGIQGGIVQPFLPRFYIEDNRKIHDRIKAFIDAYPGRFFGMASIYPHFSKEDYVTEATRCVKELGFVALKLTPIGHACDPGSRDAYTIYKTAQELGVPVMIHTGNGLPFADPSHIYKPLKDFPEVTFVIAHAGLDMFHTQAVILAEEFENCYLEPSWVSTTTLSEMKARLGAEKIMFSSDTLNNTAPELTKYRCVFTSEEEQEQVFHKTAEKVFKL